VSSITHVIRRRRNRKQRRQQAAIHNRLWSLLVIGMISLAVILPAIGAFGFIGFLYFRAVSAMPSPADTISLDPIIGPTNLYDRSGSTLLFSVSDPLGDERAWVNIERLPQYIIDATLQMEDPDYLQAGGFHLDTTLLHMWAFINEEPEQIRTENFLENSIAGRLAETTLIPAARDSGLQDAMLGILLSADVQRRFTPRRVLEWYLNTTYYGNDAYGIDAAAQIYFDKNALELSLAEVTMLAAIPPAPQFNPFEDEVAARGRQEALLRSMATSGLISDQQLQSALESELALRSDSAHVPRLAPDFAMYAREQAEDILNGIGLDGGRLVSRGGLRILTTLDMDLYYQSECILRGHLQQLRGASADGVSALTGEACFGNNYLITLAGQDSPAPPDAGTALVLDAMTGEILSMVGDAVSFEHQPGPMLHPLVYLSGFLSGNFNPATMMLDVPQTFPGPQEGLIYAPRNPDGEYRGPLNLRDAMVSGLRTPVTFVADREGLSTVFSIARSIGLNSLADTNTFDLSLIERGGEVSVLDMTYAYSVFATMGWMQGIDVEPIARNFRSRNPVAILQIEDAQGHILWQYDDEQIRLSRSNILSPEMAFLMNDILSDDGTRRNVLGIDDSVLNIGRPAALMNGTTSDGSNSWTIGYTPQLVTGVHLERHDEQPMSLDTHNLQGTAPVWQAIMQYAHDRYNLQAAGWPQPEDIVEFVVCDVSGLVPADGSPCPTRSEKFLAQVYPTQADIYWHTVEVNSDTGQLATVYTPTFLVEEAVYFVPPPAAEEWWRSRNLPLPPEEYDTVSVPDLIRSVELFLPQDFDFVGGTVDIRGSIDTDNMASYQLSFGEGFNPDQWFEIGEPQSTFAEGASLGKWDTSGLDGSYTLRLTVRRTDNTVETDFVPVTVDNTAPTITFDVDLLYRWPQDSVIPLRANVEDNRAIDRVEFYHNGSLIAVDEEAPYEVDFPIEGVGFENFSASAFDAVGLSTTTDTQVEILR